MDDLFAVFINVHKQMTEFLQSEANFVPENGAKVTFHTYSLCLFNVATHFDGIESLLHSWFSSSENSFWSTL